MTRDLASWGCLAVNIALVVKVDGDVLCGEEMHSVYVPVCMCVLMGKSISPMQGGTM